MRWLRAKEIPVRKLEKRVFFGYKKATLLLWYAEVR